MTRCELSQMYVKKKFATLYMLILCPLYLSLIKWPTFPSSSSLAYCVGSLRKRIGLFVLQIFHSITKRCTNVITITQARVQYGSPEGVTVNQSGLHTGLYSTSTGCFITKSFSVLDSIFESLEWRIVSFYTGLSWCEWVSVKLYCLVLSCLRLR